MSPLSAPASDRVRRIAALIACVLIVGSGLAVHAWAPDSAVSDIAGDALYAALTYTAIVALLPRVPATGVALGAASWCLAIELFQLTGIPGQVGAVFPPALLVLGTVFDVRDLVVYFLTSVALWALDSAVTHREVIARTLRR